MKHITGFTESEDKLVDDFTKLVLKKQHIHDTDIANDFKFRVLYLLGEC